MYEDKIWILQALQLIQEHNQLVFRVDKRKLHNISLTLDKPYTKVKSLFDRFIKYRYFVKLKENIYVIGTKYLDEQGVKEQRSKIYYTLKGKYKWKT